jgi:CxC2 like cysteine cluster associated with KDZ transposases
MTTVRTQTVRGPRVRQVPVRRSPQSTPKAKKAKNTAAASSHSKLTSLLSDEPPLHEHLNFMDDIDPPSSKVTYCFLYIKLCSYMFQTPQDYIEEWLPKKEMYLEALLSNEIPDSFDCKLCGHAACEWRCRDCLFNPILCTDCCRDNHASNPFHRIDHWTGSFFEPAWLFQVGLVLHLGHDSKPCPSYFDTSAPDVVTQEAEQYEDDLDDPTEGDGSNHIVKELKRFIGVYDLGSTMFSTPVDCHELTVVDVSGVHRMWVKWCNCPNSRERQEQHLLQMGIFPVSYKNIKSTFTFKVLDDARMSNLECKSSAYQYYQKLRRATSPLFPNAVEV